MPGTILKEIIICLLVDLSSKILKITMLSYTNPLRKKTAPKTLILTIFLQFTHSMFSINHRIVSYWVALEYQCHSVQSRGALSVKKVNILLELSVAVWQMGLSVFSMLMQ